jgi:uncharacterized membrane protein
MSGWEGREQVLGPVWYFICHRIESRCLRLGGEAQPICARCLGMFFGLLLAALDATFRGTSRLPWRYPIALLLAAVMYVDWLLGYLTGRSSHLERVITGFLGGWGLYMLCTLLVLTLGGVGWRLFRWVQERASGR